MPHLHEILAVKPRKDAEFEERRGILRDLRKTGVEGIRRVYTPLDEDGFPHPPEMNLPPARVENALGEYINAWAAVADVAIAQDMTNTMAKATVELPGMKSVELSATSLLTLEKMLEGMLADLRTIPTLPENFDWIFDPQVGYYKSTPQETVRSEEAYKVIVKYDATDKHPAQTEMVKVKVPVGTWTATGLNAGIPVTNLRFALEMVEESLRKVKEARMRANEQEVWQTDPRVVFLEFAAEVQNILQSK